MPDDGSSPGCVERTAIDITDMSNIADKGGNIDTSHDGVLSGKRDLRTESAWIMIMRLASAGRAITPTGIRIMVSYLDQTGLEHTLEKLRNQMYPVGSLYFSTNSTSPATIYGGTWERYGKGRTLVSVNESDTDFTAGKTGGEKTHRHAYGLTVGSFYGHTLIAPDSGHSAHWAGLVSYDDDTNKPLDSFKAWEKLSSGGGQPVIGASQMQGNIANPYTPERFRYETGTSSGSSMGPYIAVYIWRRTA